MLTLLCLLITCNDMFVTVHLHSDILCLPFFQLEKADQVVKTMIDHMSDVQSGATYKLSLKKGQLIKIPQHEIQ